MNEGQIDALQQATDEILAMTDEELLKDFNSPGSEYFFSDLAHAEKMLLADHE